MPTATHDTVGRPAAPGTIPDPAARVRRIVGSAREHRQQGGPESAGLRALDAALARFDAPVDIRVRGGLGSGRRTLAAALRERRGWRTVVEDLDLLAAPGSPVAAPPDIEIVCLRTAPCRHEEAWIRRPRAHALLVVATGLDNDDDEVRPRWAVDLPAVDARRPADASLDVVVGFLDRALDALHVVRAVRLEAELAQVAVHDDVGDLAESALCALAGTARS